MTDHNGASPARRATASALDAGSRGLKRAGAALATASHAIDWQIFKRLTYRSRPDDVFLVTYPRSGTTWLQMILYQLTSDGEVDFPHISDRVPWFERVQVSGKDIEAMPSPRAFKSHLSARSVPRVSSRFIYAARNGADVAVSYFHFNQSHNGFKGSFDEFFDRFMKGDVDSGSWVDHVAGWWARRDEPNVLFLWYEHMRADPEKYLDIIAEFCDIRIDPAARSRILERSALRFMKRHEARFDPVTEALWENGLTGQTFLRRGKSGEGKVVLADDQARQLEEQFMKTAGLSVADLRNASRTLSHGGPPSEM